MIEVETKRKVAQTAKTFKKNPELYFKNILGVETLEQYQKRVLNTVNENERTAIAACHDVGKSFLMARVALWFLSTNKDSKVITTAPTFNQVERILWAELRAAHSKAKFPIGGKLNNTDLTFGPEWFAIGITSRNEAGAGEGQGTQSSFQGFHAPGGILVLFDEATGIPPNVWTMAEGLLTQHKVKFVAIGNPTSSGSNFYKCFKDQAWAKVYLSCFDSPNLKANGITSIADIEKEIQKVKSMPDVEALKYLDSYKVVVPYLLTTKWVIAQAKKWGLEHPLTVSKILGKFPKASSDTLIPLDWVEAAQLRVVYPEASDRKILGIDVARFGSDSTRFVGLHGKKQLARREGFKRDTNEVAGRAIALAKELWGQWPDIIVVDETGLGGGVVDFLRAEAPDYCEIRGVQFGAACEDEEDQEKFINLKARMFGLLQDDMKAEDGLSILGDGVYLEELPTIRYTYNKKGQMVIESKDDYKKRTGRGSPDDSDALALANYGRYDELTAGKFSKTHEVEETAKTFSGGLTNKREW